MRRPSTDRPSLRLLAAVLGAALVAGACSYTVPLEPVSSVARSSFVYASDGRLLTRMHAEEDREPVGLDEIADVLEDAVIAVEDERYYTHAGVDVRATFRALFRNIEEGSVEQGGSTITQQYVKNVLIGRERTVGRKIKEASLAYQVERNHSKDEILERYLNTVYFGNGAYGAEAAAKRFFDKSASDLTLAEAALLAGMIRAPERYDPYDSPEASEARRHLVLRRMHEAHMIDDDERDSAMRAELELAAPRDRHPAPHYVKAVQRFIEGHEAFGETRQERRDLLFKGGLRVHTNVDLGMQRAAREAVEEILADEDVVVSALVAMEPVTGKVRATWGGYDFFEGHAKAKFDYATKGRRQAGSAFKPFALVAALDDGMSPEQLYRAPSRITLDVADGTQEWRVSNYGGGGYGTLTLTEATVRSVNTVYAQLILDIGPQKATEIATEMGIESELEPFPSAVLGTNVVTPLDMASAYATLAGDGVRADPMFVDEVVDASGNTIYEAEPRPRRVLSEMVARNTNEILQDVPTRGTALAARLSDGRDQAGKTGTAQRWRDAWYVGYTPDLVAAVWVGHPEGQVEMRPPLTDIRVTGGSYPARIWKAFMEVALEDVPPSEFPDAPPFEATKELKTRVPCSRIFVRVEDAETGEIEIVRDYDPEELLDEGYTERAIDAAGSCPRPATTTTSITTTSSTTTTTTTSTTTTTTSTTTTTAPPTTTTTSTTTTTAPPTTTTTSTTTTTAPDETTTTT